MGENLLADVVASYQEERHPPGQYLGLEDEVPATLAVHGVAKCQTQI